MMLRGPLHVVCMLIVIGTAIPARAGAVLEIVEVPGDQYTITAVDDQNPSIQYWRCKVDVTGGGIYSFVDLTDAGDGAHTDYLGNGGYGRKCGLLQFNGRGGQVGSRANSVNGLADRLAFEQAPDGSWFKIVYLEDDTSTGFFQSSYSAGDISLTPGDLLTTITVTIRPPTSAGTAWDWSIVQRNVSDHGIDPRAWARQEVRTYIDGAISPTLDSETSNINGLWDDAAPVSFGRFTIGPNDLGLTAVREFIVDYRYDLIGKSHGNAVSGSAWAGYDFINYQAPYNTSSNHALEAGQVRGDFGQLRINIAAPAVGAAPVADAGDDQAHTIHTVDPASVTLDASGSYDPDGVIVGYTWTDIAGEIIATGSIAALDLPEGDYYFTLIVEDDDGNVAYDEIRVEVIFEWDYTLYDAWPGRDPNDPNQLVNLHGQSMSRPVIRDLVWPANPGEADVCLYADDKFAAVSLTIDDNIVPNHAWWVQQAALHDFHLTWFVIVGSHRLNSGNAFFGTWEVFQANVVDSGHEVQSHTVSHKGDDDTRPADEMHWEYSYSRALIDEHLTGNRCLTLAYPSGRGQADLCALYYIAARGTTGGANLPHNTNYMFTKAGSLSAIPEILNSANVNYARGWIVPLWHLIHVEDYPGMEAQLAEAASHSDRIWFGSFTDVAKYGQQRDTATLTVVSADEAAGVTMTLTDRMFDDVFDYPLTIKVRVWNSWTDCAATQDGEPVAAELIIHEGDAYVLVKAVPDRGTIVVTAGSPAMPGDANGDGRVDLDDFVILKSNFGITEGATWSMGDFNGDGAVNLDDFVILKQYFGR